ELVDDLHLAVLNDVVDVALVQRLRLQSLVQMVDELDVPGVVEVVETQSALDLLDRDLERRDRLELLVVEEVDTLRDLILEPFAPGLRLPLRKALPSLGDAREVDVLRRVRLGLAGDDQRRACLVDE